MTFETWLAFLVAAILISVSPGAGAVACMATGMRYGYRLGIWNIFGMQVGIALQLAVVGALTFIPALALGPIVEHLMLHV